MMFSDYHNIKQVDETCWETLLPHFTKTYPGTHRRDTPIFLEKLKISKVIAWTEFSHIKQKPLGQYWINHGNSDVEFEYLIQWTVCLSEKIRIARLFTLPPESNVQRLRELEWQGYETTRGVVLRTHLFCASDVPSSTKAQYESIGWLSDPVSIVQCSLLF